jgi:Raf kinase inhibitor-like YbhB/YbcL family protein
MAIALSSPAFQNGESIPREWTGDGEDHSPPLTWTDPPPATRSLALICDDPDAPRGTFTHWIVFNLPPELRELRAGVGHAIPLPAVASQGTNDFGRVRYGGPAPPPGKPHRYSFRLFALDQRLDLKARAIRSEVLSAMEGHVLESSELMGTYGR